MEVKLRIPGYWVASEDGKIMVTLGEFDDTELSDHSKWTEAWQNEDPSLPHGFIDPLTMLRDVSEKIAGQTSDDDFKVASAKFSVGASCPVNTLEDLARLMQLVLPKNNPTAKHRKAYGDG
jgi:hypothetical protein